ncbi:hypothetical protein RKD52_003677 [Metabacillus sp. SLBN-84]
MEILLQNLLRETGLRLWTEKEVLFTLLNWTKDLGS